MLYKIRYTLKYLFFTLFLILNSNQLTGDEKQKYVLGGWAGGMGANFHWILQNLQYCEVRNYIPVIYWGKNSYYYDINGLNGETGNTWEYYFEPVSDLLYEHGDVIHTGYD